MSEEQKTEVQQPTTNNAAGSEPSTDSYFERADAYLKRLEETEKRLDQKKADYDKILGRDLLSGRSLAGQPKKTAEEEKQERIDAEVKKIVGSFLK